jgi:uncharacterized protein (TIGR00288 family)
MPNEEERIALFLDFENLALGARDRGEKLDMAVILNALSERGRVVVRRAYADWNLFSDERQNVLSQRIEMLEIPQRSGQIRKNAADIKLAVDAIELALQRDFVTTFVIGSGDSDFTPLVLKLRELDKRVIGIGVEGSTSQLLPGACDEFLFYERLLGSGGNGASSKKREGAARTPSASSDVGELAKLVTSTLAGLQRSSEGPVLSSMIKRAILRKDPTFSEGDYGFRTWSEAMRHLQKAGIVLLQEGSSSGDPAVDFPTDGGGETRAMELLSEVVASLEKQDGSPPLSGLKNHLRRREPGFSEKNYGYGGFLQFVKAAAAKGVVDLEWDDEMEDYYLSVTS